MIIRAVLDTNIWIASINWRGTAFQIREFAQAGTFTSITSLPALVEVSRVLRQYFAFSDEVAYEWYCHIGELSEIVLPVQELNVVVDDPDDNKFIECAVEGNAQYIVSQDKDLLRLKQYRDIQIVNAQTFLNHLISA